MKRMIVWLFPTVFIACCLALNTICATLKINSELLDFIMYIIAVYGIGLITPCFYVILISRYSNNTKKFLYSILCALGCITLNAMIVGYRSFMYYLGIKQRGVHDLDLFPAYMIVPIGITMVGVCIILILKLIKKNTNNK